jgi:hypothetical protein
MQIYDIFSPTIVMDQQRMAGSPEIDPMTSAATTGVFPERVELSRWVY